MGAKIQAFDIFQTPLSSHYPQPLSDEDVKLHALLSYTPEYDAPFQSAGLAGSTVL